MDLHVETGFLMFSNIFFLSVATGQLVNALELSTTTGY